LIVLVATGAAPSQLTAAANAVITAAIPVVIVGGVLRLLRERGVTVQAVAGALAIYLAVGLVFAWIIGFIMHVNSTPYFAQHTNGTEGDRVYFSFTVLTTTGFGDFSAATPVGHAISVIEMLTGQLYLVTVIGLLIGNFVSRQKRTP
ncbi:MAG: potassium channel family protein, partial [Solirubrobacteraceae bacterium]